MNRCHCVHSCIKQVCSCVSVLACVFHLSSDLWFGFNCCVNLSSTLMGFLALMLPRHISSQWQHWSVCCWHTPPSSNPNTNLILINQLHHTCQMTAHPYSFRPVCYIYRKIATVMEAAWRNQGYYRVNLFFFFFFFLESSNIITFLRKHACSSACLILTCWNIKQKTLVWDQFEAITVSPEFPLGHHSSSPWSLLWGSCIYACFYINNTSKWRNLKNRRWKTTLVVLTTRTDDTA